jgi:5-methylcytosine-specific restriction endonuclease McrA
MPKHVENFYKSRGIYPGEVVLCEKCGRHTVNIHHILFKSQGGSDEPENLIALCTGDNSCHDIAHGKVKGKSFTREELFKIAKEKIGVL